MDNLREFREEMARAAKEITSDIVDNDEAMAILQIGREVEKMAPDVARTFMHDLVNVMMNTTLDPLKTCSIVVGIMLCHCETIEQKDAIFALAKRYTIDVEHP